jgi:chromosomal replication initiation ATPase DnaA
MTRDVELTPAEATRARRRLRRLRADAEALRLVRLVAFWRDVPIETLVHTTRCAADIALSRQIAMYLVHTALSRNYDTVAVLFRRDRTTVAHACAQIEDLRDDRLWDRRLAAIEERFRPRQDTSAREASYAAA